MLPLPPLRPFLLVAVLVTICYYGFEATFWLFVPCAMLSALILAGLYTLRETKEKVVEVDDEGLLGMSAMQIARLIREGKVTSVEAVETFIRQIEKVNPVLNAVVATRFEEARKEAQQADLLMKTTPIEDLPPLHGVPCSVKEAFAVIGMPNSSGLVARKHIRCKEDAVVVQRLRKAGAIPLGVTNTSELCMWMESNNKIYGRTNNPYHIGHTVGGSSGGEACILAACGAPFGVGSDIGGSIRMPAYFCGIFGHKPTGGLVPNEGQFPIAVGDALKYLCTGPMSKRAEDLMPLLKLMAGPEGEDKIGDMNSVDIKNVTILYGDTPFVATWAVHRELKVCRDKCISHLASLGAKEVRQIDMKRFRHTFDIWSSMLEAAGGPTFSELLGNGKEVRASYELFKWLTGLPSAHTLPAIGLALIEALPKLTPTRAKRLVELGKELRKEMHETLGENGVLVCPTFPTTAPKHHMALFPPTNFVHTAVWNVLETPVTCVPMGLDHKGLPMGLQLVASRGNDHLTIALALELEKKFGGWVAPRKRAV